MKAIEISREQLYELAVVQNKTRQELENILQCTKSPILRCAKKYNIGLRKTRGGNVKYSVNYDFFHNYNNAYWAGFIAADGCISVQHNRVRIKLSSKDLQLLEEFRQQTKFNGPISEDYTMINGTTYKRNTISIVCKQWVEDLKLYWNITERKSLTLQPPNTKNIDEKLKYIVGYIDGDGYIGFNKLGKPRLEICGSNDILSWISNTLYGLEKNSYDNPMRVMKYRNKNCYRLQCSSNRADNLIHQLLEIETPYRLPRKWSNHV